MIDADDYYTDNDIILLAGMKVVMPPSPACPSCKVYMHRMRYTAIYVCPSCNTEVDLGG